MPHIRHIRHRVLLCIQHPPQNRFSSFLWVPIFSLKFSFSTRINYDLLPEHDGSRFKALFPLIWWELSGWKWLQGRKRMLGKKGFWHKHIHLRPSLIFYINSWKLILRCTAFLFRCQLLLNYDGKLWRKKMKTLADRKRDKFYSRRKRQLGNIK